LDIADLDGHRKKFLDDMVMGNRSFRTRSAAEQFESFILELAKAPTTTNAINAFNKSGDSSCHTIFSTYWPRELLIFT